MANRGFQFLQQSELALRRERDPSALEPFEPVRQMFGRNAGLISITSIVTKPSFEFPPIVMEPVLSVRSIEFDRGLAEALARLNRRGSEPEGS